ncbi:MAG: two-component system sensor histidine kinase NtrB [Gammaproteobacteria bacterium]|nr:MAG: two-component system sensor histidine kinase NtrB [Gammaproteobacteria bacterium]
MDSLANMDIPSNTQVIEHLNTAIMMFDDEARLVYINPAAEMLFSLSARQADAMLASDVLMGNEDLLKTLADSLQTGHTSTERESSLLLQDGSQISVDCTLTGIQNKDGHHAVLLEMIRVDRLMRISREENLLVQNQAARMLVRGIAHEIKNPLGGLRGAAQLLEKEFTDDSLKEYTNVIIGEADRLRNLVNKMLGPINVPKKQQTNLHEVLERVRTLVLAESDKDIRIVRDYDVSIPVVHADIDQLIQVVLNITSNAVRAIEDKGAITFITRVERQYTIGTRHYPLVARIDIKDDGIGIEKEMLESIFMPMVTAFADGTGLGLSIAQSLVNQIGGLIEYQSEPGNTVFTVLIPIETMDEV